MKSLATVLLLLVVAAADAWAVGKAGSSGGGSPALAPAAGGRIVGGGGRGLADPRSAPPLDPKRKINEQDCSKPIDLAAGNLKCK